MDTQDHGIRVPSGAACYLPLVRTTKRSAQRESDPHSRQGSRVKDVVDCLGNGSQRPSISSGMIGASLQSQ